MSAATAVAVSSPPPPQCQVILTLAHLLQQHSLSYDDEKNLLLDTSVKCAMKMANQSRGEVGAGEEVHMVLTGSPRPTFAETNAWLLEGQSSPKKTDRNNVNNNNDGNDNADAMSVDDDNDDSPTNSSSNNTDQDERMTSDSGAQLMQEYIAECTHNSSTRNANMDDLGGSPTRLGGSVLRRYSERKYSHGDMGAGVVAAAAAAAENDQSNEGNSTRNNDESSTNKGPMVGHAVVNAISQAHGIGLRSSRARLLQGTIDRPLWDQRRWTDGECLFSELVDRCGLESFENVGVAGSHLGSGGGGGADAAGGGGSSMLGTTGLRLQKTTNLSAHLITVPATIITESSGNAMGEVPGLAEDTIEEIARGILRCLKRKKSPPASKVYLVLPPDFSGGERQEERRQVVSERLAAAWQKLERYNDMIGAPKLMANAQFEFVDVMV